MTVEKENQEQAKSSRASKDEDSQGTVTRNGREGVS
jgi:hypothetical protein